MRERSCYSDINVPAHQTTATRKVHYTVVFGTCSKLPSILMSTSSDQYAFGRTYHAFTASTILLIEATLEPRQALLRHGAGHGVRKLGSGRSRTRAIKKAEAAVEADLTNEVERLAKVAFRLARKSDYKIRSERQLRSDRSQPASFGTRS